MVVIHVDDDDDNNDIVGVDTAFCFVSFFFYKSWNANIVQFIISFLHGRILEFCILKITFSRFACAQINI